MITVNINSGSNCSSWFSNQIECELLRFGFGSLGIVSNQNHQRINLFNIHYSFYSYIDFIMHRIGCHKSAFMIIICTFFPDYIIFHCWHKFSEWRRNGLLCETRIARPLSLYLSLSRLCLSPYTCKRYISSSSLGANKDAGQSSQILPKIIYALNIRGRS